MFIVIPLISACLLEWTLAQECSGVPPHGLDKLRKGVDITTLDVLPLDVGAQKGFRGNVIDYVCTNKRSWTNPINKVKISKKVIKLELQTFFFHPHTSYDKISFPFLISCYEITICKYGDVNSQARIIFDRNYAFSRHPTNFRMRST